MKKTTLFNNIFVVFSIPALLILSLIWLVQSPYFKSYPEPLSNAIILDLLLTIPIIYYLLIKKKKIPKTTIIPIFFIGMLVGFSIIPSQYQSPLYFVKTWILPFIELGVLAYATYKIFKAAKLFRKHKNTSTDFFTVAKNVSEEIVNGKIAIFLATEIAVVYYGFINWKKKNLNKNEFSYHKKTGSITLFMALIFVIIIETIVAHIVLSKWNVTVAWILTGLSIYSGIQILAIAKSLAKRPIIISNNKVYLRYGILNETIIDIDEIEFIELSNKEIENNKKIRKLSPIANSEGHNIILHLKKENTLSRFYGFNKTYEKIAFFVDEKEVFKNQIESLLNS